MKMWVGLTGLLLLPVALSAQGGSGEVRSLQSVLDQLYTDMMPLCSQLIGVSRLIAGFGALWYIGSRVWKHIAVGEPVEIYPLLRPFVLGFCILIFPSVIDLINGILHPTVAGTEAMVKNSNTAVEKYLKAKEAVEANSGFLESINPSSWVRELLKGFLELVFEAASLCINTIRTFYLIVLSILGPLVFGIGIYDGFQHTVTVWLARYINIYLWLPVANIFGAMIAKIQENMLLADLAANPYSTTGSAYLVFLVISIIGYFAVPSVANYIVNAGGGNALLSKVSNMSSSVAKSTVGMAADAFGNGASRMSGNMADNATTNDYFKDKVGGK